MKKEVRVIGWDDCRLSRKRRVQLIGAIFRGGLQIDGMLSAFIERDGLDATEKITSAIVNSRHFDQLSAIMLDGISFAGFNLVDIKALHKNTGLSVIVVQRKKPDIKKFTEAQSIFSSYKKRLVIVRNAGKLYRWKSIYYQKAGINNIECAKLLGITCIRANIPEPVRVAHIIATGMAGESRGRA